MKIEKNGNKVRFEDIYNISHDTWTLFFKRMNYLGYGFTDVDMAGGSA